MTSLSGSIIAERILSLPERIWQGDTECIPAIESVSFQSDALWVLGQHILFKSRDGVNWENLAANLRREGSFYVSSVIQGAADLRIFARTRSGLKCFRWDKWDSNWKALFSIPTSSPGLFSAWTHSGLVIAAKQNPTTEIICRESDIEDRPRWRSTLPGSAVHLQIASSGIGLCALWEKNGKPSNSDSRHSAVYSTNDSGQNWRVVATMETMLLAGASIDENTAFVGGTGGVLGLVDNVGLQELWKEDAGDIVAVDATGSGQIAIIESDDEPAVQSLLFRNGTGNWTRSAAAFDGRVQAIKLVAPGKCLVCASQSIYMCQFE
jgi:hypothetical protein